MAVRPLKVRLITYTYWVCYARKEVKVTVACFQQPGMIRLEGAEQLFLYYGRGCFLKRVNTRGFFGY